MVDDDADFRAFAIDLLERSGFEALEAPTGERALSLADEQAIALVVLDVNLPGASGYSVCSELRQRLGSGLPIVFVSGERCESFDRVAGLLIGADDYLVKPFDPDEFVARIARMLDRCSLFVEAREPQNSYRMTPREREVLELLVEGLSQVEIAKQLYVSPKTVGTHIQHILGKLGVRSRTQAVSIAVRERLVVLTH